MIGGCKKVVDTVAPNTQSLFCHKVYAKYSKKDIVRMQFPTGAKPGNWSCFVN